MTTSHTHNLAVSSVHLCGWGKDSWEIFHQGTAILSAHLPIPKITLLSNHQRW